MKFADLDLRFASDTEGRRWITFECPKCRGHHIAVQILGKPEKEGGCIWGISGDMEHITLTPSVASAIPIPNPPETAGIYGVHKDKWEYCAFHFTVINGEVNLC